MAEACDAYDWSIFNTALDPSVGFDAPGFDGSIRSLPAPPRNPTPSPRTERSGDAGSSVAPATHRAGPGLRPGVRFAAKDTGPRTFSLRENSGVTRGGKPRAPSGVPRGDVRGPFRGAEVGEAPRSFRGDEGASSTWA
jgi:hypothetical protein